jgi:GTP-binding protein EngB required for normal cell division
MDHSKLLNWYERLVRPFLEEQARDRLPALDNDRDRLKRLLERRDGITICFLGNSGIGKSTLLNALAAGDKQVLPAGGIGPLTAQATEVHFSETPVFTVTYHKRGKLMKVGFALERRLERLTKAASKSAAEPTFENELPEDEKKTLLAEEKDVEAGIEGQPATDPVEDYVKQAKQLVTGNQFSPKPLPYLVDAIALACGGKMRWNVELDAEDMQRVTRIQKVLELAKDGKALTQRPGESLVDFMTDLNAHAAGFLSPLIQKIEVGWPSTLLNEGVVLVDLPGVGIAQDTYREITKRYVREQARAVVLVVDRAGPTQATIDLLRSSGYWDRLVGAADDPGSDPCHLLVVVTRVDDVANEEWAQTSHLPKDERPKKRAVFESRVESFRPRIRDQLREQLSRITSSDNEAVQTAREAAVANLLADMRVHPVSAPEYRRFLAEDEDDLSFLPNAEATGVPALAEEMRGLCVRERESRHAAIGEVSQRLARAILGELQIVESLWSDRDRAAAEAEKLGSALQAMIGPKEKEYTLRVGAFREFLESTVTTRIRELVLEAQKVAEAEVSNYLLELRNEHWATLRATVRRGGVWLYGRGRAVNLPDDIANFFQEPMAAVWSQKLLKDIRKRTSELAQDISNMVEEICTWAHENGGTTVNREVLNRQRERMEDQVAQLRQVGKEAVDELRDVVKQKLMEVIKKPIIKACDEFVARGDDIGSGVKYRILQLFSDLSRQATQAAEKPAIDVLKKNFTIVREEIRIAFEEWGDPVSDTANLIVTRHEDRLKRSDAQRRGKVLAQVEALLEKNPTDIVEPAIEASTQE